MFKVKRAAGFTLIEMMIVVAILTVLASIAINNLVRARIETNEVAAIANLKTICGAQATYNIANHAYGTLADLTSDPSGLGVAMLSGSWPDGVGKNGYLYLIEDVDVTEADFVCYATPSSPGKTGIHYFRVDSSGVIRRSSTGQPSATDEAIGTAAN